jgi:hypothetical protein
VFRWVGEAGGDGVFHGLATIGKFHFSFAVAARGRRVLRPQADDGKEVFAVGALEHRDRNREGSFTPMCQMRGVEGVCHGGWVHGTWRGGWWRLGEGETWRLGAFDLINRFDGVELGCVVLVEDVTFTDSLSCARAGGDLRTRLNVKDGKDSNQDRDFIGFHDGKKNGGVETWD